MEGKRIKHNGGVSLPVDVVFDVLTRVPAKALCRFRCVCKGWRALISDPDFIAAQRSRDPSPHLVSVFLEGNEVRVMDMQGNAIRMFEVRVLGKDEGTDILGALRQVNRRFDFICCVHDGTRINANAAMIIDPAAGRASTVLMGTRTSMPSFGRSALSGAFKVMCLEEALGCQICKVATIVEGGAEPLTWRQRSAPPFLSWLTEERATVNGVVYFMARLNWHDEAQNLGSHRIAAFCLESEEWKMINGPTLQIQRGTCYDITLAELKGTLTMVQCKRNDDRYYCNIWLLIDFNESEWVKEYTIQMPTTWKFTKQLGALDDGRILLLVSKMEKITKKNTIAYHFRDVVVLYNPSTKAFTNLMDIAKGSRDKLFLYTWSLLS